jgi:uncharacterized repeat protein (TIGR03803 family)
MKATRKSLAVSRTLKLHLFRFQIALLVLAVALGAAGAQAQTVTIKSIRDLGTVAGDPINPQWVGLIAQGRDGNMYTTTPKGLASGSVGTAFKITPTGKLTVLHNFNPNTKIPEGTPYSGLVLGTDGNFWGTTYNGGHTGCANNQGCGQVFKMTPAGKVTFVYTFTGGNDGGNPVAPPIEASNGMFYGTTQYGGIDNLGTVYQITESGALTTMFPFDGNNGDHPTGALVQATNGVLYGTTDGSSCGDNCSEATIFGITTGSAFTELYAFPNFSGPVYNGLVQAYDGDLWGTIAGGGANDCGQIFKITTKGVESDEYDFKCGSDGSNPVAGLLLGTDGNLYGVTQNGGQDSLGEFFSITEKAKFTALKWFDGSNGAHPTVTLIQHTNGTIYGDANEGGKTTNTGTFYEVTGLALEKTPFVSLVLNAGKVGSTVEILGQGFVKEKTTVSFNGASPINATVMSATYLTAIVPPKATTGFVTVTTPTAKLTSNRKFQVLK